MDAAPTAPAAAPLDKGKAKLGPPPPPVMSAPAPIDTAAQPWVEKYRPKTLDDVCAHREIIDTSAWNGEREGESAGAEASEHAGAGGARRNAW